MAQPISSRESNEAASFSRIAIVVDNTYSSAASFDSIKNAIRTIAKKYQNSEIAIIETVEPNQNLVYGSYENALKEIEAIEPKLAFPDRDKALDLIRKAASSPDTRLIYFYDGFTHKNQISDESLKAIAEIANEIYLPRNLPSFISLKDSNVRHYEVAISNYNLQNKIYAIEAFNQKSEAIKTWQVEVPASDSAYAVKLERLSDEQNLQQIAGFRIRGENHSGAVWIEANEISFPNVAMVTSSLEKQSNQPLLDPEYYIEKAIADYSTFSKIDYSASISDDISLVIVPEPSAMNQSFKEQIDEYVRKGGNVLYIADSSDKAISFDSIVSSEKEQKIGGFNKESRFKNLQIPKDISFKRVAIADSEQVYENLIWLENGVSLLSGYEIGDGYVYQLNSGITDEWSNIALSGFFVELLKEISGKRKTSSDFNGRYEPEEIHNIIRDSRPVYLLDVYGRISSLGQQKSQSGIVQAGVYENSKGSFAVNISPQVNPMKKVELSKARFIEDITEDRNFVIIIIIIALTLIFGDLLYTLFGNKFAALRRLAIAFCFIVSYTAQANAEEVKLADSDNIALGCVRSNHNAVNELCLKALTNISRELDRRTSAKMRKPMLVELDSPDINLLPVIVYTIESEQIGTSDYDNMLRYMNNGGVILFDSRGRIATNSSELSSLIGFGESKIVDGNHVLKKTFYLVDNFVGANGRKALYIPDSYNKQGEGISPAIFTDADFISMWAAIPENIAVIASGGDLKYREMEMSVRSGVNIVLYSMTGNYKNDNIHLSIINERKKKTQPKNISQ